VEPVANVATPRAPLVSPLLNLVARVHIHRSAKPTCGRPRRKVGDQLATKPMMRFDVRRIGQVKIGDELVGGRTRVNVAKNKF
jgi:hypothetical protein